MTTTKRVADPIAEYVGALRGALRGPRRTRRSMVAEAHAGLTDGAAAYRDGGVAAERAAVLAVRDFGPVAVVAPEFQEELTARQGRRAAILLAMVFPAMLLGWDLLWMSGTVRREPSASTDLVRTLAVTQDLITAVVAVTALALLATTFRRAVSPRALTNTIGLTGVTGALLCGGIAIAMNTAGGPGATTPAAMAAYTVSATVMILTMSLSVRTLHVAMARQPKPA
ncbi:hypothetical protein [Actinophytocola sediminis]